MKVKKRYSRGLQYPNSVVDLLNWKTFYISYFFFIRFFKSTARFFFLNMFYKMCKYLQIFSINAQLSMPSNEYHCIKEKTFIFFSIIPMKWLVDKSKKCWLPFFYHGTNISLTNFHKFFIQISCSFFFFLLKWELKVRYLYLARGGWSIKNCDFLSLSNLGTFCRWVTF